MEKVPMEPFDPATFLSCSGVGRRLVRIRALQPFFTQGDSADCVFYLRSGRAKLAIVSTEGKEATIALIGEHEFIGEEAIVGSVGYRSATVTAISTCVALKISRREMIRVIHQEHKFSDMFVSCLLASNMRTQANLVHQLFNSSEKRLARILLILAEFGQPNAPETLIPQMITQKALAEMVGTTRSRVNIFMNRFRKLGFIEYNGRIRVHKSLLKAVLQDELPDRPDTSLPPTAFLTGKIKET